MAVTILLHTSKTTKQPEVRQSHALPGLCLSDQTTQLSQYLKTLSKTQLQKTMAISETKAAQVSELIQAFGPNRFTLPALDLFLGDIYSGLQAQSLTPEDRNYANQHLFILSGLYGVLKALDEIQPYRLEMGYKLPGNAHDPSQPNITSLY